MGLEFPQFQSEYLIYFTACARVELATVPAELVEWLGQERVRHSVEITYTTPKGEAVLELLANRTMGEDEDDFIHLHIDCGLEEYSDIPDEPKPQQEALDFYSKFFGLQGIGVYFDTVSRIPIDDLPRRGIIDSMLGAGTNIGDAKLVLNGASVQISDEKAKSIWRKLRWHECSPEGNVLVRMDAFIPKLPPFADNYLNWLEALAEQGLSRYVLETSKVGEDND